MMMRGVLKMSEIVWCGCGALPTLGLDGLCYACAGQLVDALPANHEYARQLRGAMDRAVEALLVRAERAATRMPLAAEARARGRLH